MVPHLRILLVSLWVLCVAGAVVTAGLSQGYYSWLTFAWAAIFGIAIGVPAALLNWAHLRPNRAREVARQRRAEPVRCSLKAARGP